MVEEGASVNKNDTIAVLESMKMEFPIISKYDGVVKKVYVKSSQYINAGQMIVAIKAAN